MSYGDAIDELSTPPVKRTIMITIPEGLSRDQVAETVSAAGVSGDYLKATERSPLTSTRRQIRGAEGGATSRASSSRPPTSCRRRATANDLVERQLDAFKERIAGIDLAYAEVEEPRRLRRAQ